MEPGGNTRRWFNRPLRRGERKSRLLGRLLLLLFIVWLVGFGLFARYAASTGFRTLPSGDVYDAAIVLTGGPGRLQTAAELLRRNRVRQVLVSGVHRDVTASDLQKMLSLPQALTRCCLLIDKRAKNTWHNAEESAKWTRSINARSVVLITADYHVPRSLYLFRHELEQLSDRAVTVVPLAVETADPATYLFVEYHKYLISLALHFRWKG